MAFGRSSQPGRLGSRSRARIARERCEGNIKKGIWTGGVGSARAEQNSGTRFVDGIIFYRVIGSTGRRARARALVIHVNTRLGVATEDAV